MRERSGWQDVPERSGPLRAGAACLYSVRCRCFCSLIVKEELNIFSLGLSPNLEAEEKMWWGVGRGLESEMRSRVVSADAGQDFFPGEERSTRRATDEIG